MLVLALDITNEIYKFTILARYVARLHIAIRTPKRGAKELDSCGPQYPNIHLNKNEKHKISMVKHRNITNMKIVLEQK